MNMARPISESEYESRWDAESLAKAEEIKSDPARYQKAQNAAVKMAEEKRKELSGINRVANSSKSRKTTPKSPANRINASGVKSKVANRSKKQLNKGANVFNVFGKV